MNEELLNCHSILKYYHTYIPKRRYLHHPQCSSKIIFNCDVVNIHQDKGRIASLSVLDSLSGVISASFHVSTIFGIFGVETKIRELDQTTNVRPWDS